MIQSWKINVHQREKQIVIDWYTGMLQSFMKNSGSQTNLPEKILNEINQGEMTINWTNPFI